MQLEVRVNGDGTGERVALTDAVFARPFNEALIHQVVVAYLAGARAGTRGQKNRSRVQGGGAKPWRQKGTGRARHGTIRSPLWRGGGRAFAAQPKSYAQKVNRKMYRGAMRSILAELARQDRLVLVDSLGLERPKTRELLGRLRQLELMDVLIVAEPGDRNLQLAARNLPTVEIGSAASLDPVSLLAHEKILLTVPALKQLEQRLA